LFSYLVKVRLEYYGHELQLVPEENNKTKSALAEINSQFDFFRQDYVPKLDISFIF